MLITGISERTTLELLLQALLTNQKQLSDQISEVRGKLTDNQVPKSTAAPKAAPAAPKAPAKTDPKPAKKAARAPMSEEGRLRIVAAQKARWAKIRKEAKKADKAAKTPGQRLNLASGGLAAAG